MASLKNTLINDTGYLGLPSGTTAQRPSSPATGYMRWNTTESYAEVYNGTDWAPIGVATAVPLTVDFLVVAGGGGGGSTGDAIGAAGGGAGGLLTSYGSNSGGGALAGTSLTLSAGTDYTVTVGAGGGSPSSSNSAYGGGRLCWYKLCF